MIIGNYVRIGNYITSGGGSGFPLSKFSLQYNNTDATYMTNGGVLRPDVLSIRTNANLLGIYKVSDNADPNTGLTYDFVNDQLVVMIQVSGGGEARHYDRSGVLQSTTFLASASQGISKDPTTQRYYAFSGAVAPNNFIRIYDFTGTQVDSFLPPADYVGGGVLKDPFSDKVYVAHSGGGKAVLIYEKIANVWTNTGSTWFTSDEGIALDYLRGNRMVFWRDVTFFESFSLSGEVLHQQFQAPTASSFKEGVVKDPKDNTLWYCTDEGFHAGTTDGNDLWHADPERTFRKYFNSPDMIPWSAWHGVTTSGTYNNSTITGGVIYSPVYDAAAHTFHQALSTMTFTGGTGTVRARSSAVAPDGNTRFTGDYLGDTGYYANTGSSENDVWGTTVPGAYESTVTARYFQLEITLEDYTPVEEWTPLSLGSKLKAWWQFTDDYSGVLRTITSTDNSLVLTRAYNKCNPGVFDMVGSTSPAYSTSQHALQCGTNNMIIQNVGSLVDDTQGEINALCAKTAAATNAIIFGTELTGNAGDEQYVFQHFGSGDTHPNTLGVRATDATEGIELKLTSPTDATTTFKLRTLRSDGVSVKAFTELVEQTLTAQTGANTGQWLSSTASNLIRIGRRTATAGSEGSLFLKDMIYTDPLTDAERQAYNDYLVRIGLK